MFFWTGGASHTAVRRNKHGTSRGFKPTSLGDTAFCLLVYHNTKWDTSLLYNGDLALGETRPRSIFCFGQRFFVCPTRRFTSISIAAGRPTRKLTDSEKERERRQRERDRHTDKERQTEERERGNRSKKQSQPVLAVYVIDLFVWKPLNVRLLRVDWG